tara:strand:+ start:51096 stop:52058 length:963 start_codon:yes stop_codon:yes gene_type:complete
MKTSASLLNIRRIGLLIAAAILGLAATVLVKAYVNKTIEKVSGGELKARLFARKTMEEGSVIKQSDLISVDVPKRYVHFRAVPSEDKGLILGQKIAATVRQGEAILWEDVALEESYSLSDYVDVTERGLTIRVDQTSSFNGMIEPGDRVDVMGVLSEQNVSGGEATLQVLLQNAFVLAVNDRIDRQTLLSVGGSAQSSEDRRDVSSVTLKVSPEDAAMVLFAQNQGQLFLSLRNRSDIFISNIPPINTRMFVDMLAAKEDSIGEGLPQEVDNYPVIRRNAGTESSGYYPGDKNIQRELKGMDPYEFQDKAINVKRQERNR